MAKLFADVEAMGAKPGLWYRPFKAWDEIPDDERLIADRDYFDPSLPRLRERVKADTARFAAWGAKLIKIDYLCFDLTGTWPTDLSEGSGDREIGNGEATAAKASEGTQGTGCKLIADGRVWRDRSRTSVEVMKDLYTAMREGAGDDVVIIGCNAINHLAAGLFEVLRTGNDTSGRRWEQTRKYGVNALGMRAIQNGTFFQADPDCVGLASAGAIDWRNNAAWTAAASRWAIRPYCLFLLLFSFPVLFLWYNTDMRKTARRGQTLVEYVLAFCALLAAVGALGFLLRATKSSVVRTEKLVGSDYP